MARPLRLHCPGGVFHLISRCARDRWLLKDGDPAREHFHAALLSALTRSDAALLAYAAMSNHVHLVVQAGQQPLSLLMKRFLGSLATRLNRGLQASGCLVASRHTSLLVQTERYLLRLVAYVHANPVRAGVVEDPCDSPWTSARAYARGSDPLVQVGRTAELLGLDLPALPGELEAEAARCVSRDPQLSADSERELDNALRKQAGASSASAPAQRTTPLLGDARFLDAIRQEGNWDGPVLHSGGLSALVRLAPVPTGELALALALILEVVGVARWEACGERPPEVVTVARQVAVRMGAELASLTPAQLAPLIGVTHQAASHLCQRTWTLNEEALYRRVRAALGSGANIGSGKSLWTTG